MNHHPADRLADTRAARIQLRPPSSHAQQKSGWKPAFPLLWRIPGWQHGREKASNFNGGCSAPLPLGGKEEAPLGTTGFRRAL
jgi:hypothetical protein